MYLVGPTLIYKATPEFMGKPPLDYYDYSRSNKLDERETVVLAVHFVFALQTSYSTFFVCDIE